MFFGQLGLGRADTPSYGEEEAPRGQQDRSKTPWKDRVHVISELSLHRNKGQPADIVMRSISLHLENPKDHHPIPSHHPVLSPLSPSHPHNSQSISLSPSHHSHSHLPTLPVTILPDQWHPVAPVVAITQCFPIPALTVPCHSS